MMLLCWSDDPCERPDFAAIVAFLDDIYAMSAPENVAREELNHGGQVDAPRLHPMMQVCAMYMSTTRHAAV
jgi:hypothetical protein